MAERVRGRDDTTRRRAFAYALAPWSCAAHPARERIKREHGVRFDAIIRAADGPMHGDDVAKTSPRRTRRAARASATNTSSEPPPSGLVGGRGQAARQGQPEVGRVPTGGRNPPVARTGVTTIFSRDLLALQFPRTAGDYVRSRGRIDVRVFADFAPVSRALRPTARPVGLFATRLGGGHSVVEQERHASRSWQGLILI